MYDTPPDTDAISIEKVTEKSANTPENTPQQDLESLIDEIGEIDEIHHAEESEETEAEKSGGSIDLFRVQLLTTPQEAIQYVTPFMATFSSYAVEEEELNTENEEKEKKEDKEVEKIDYIESEMISELIVELLQPEPEPQPIIIIEPVQPEPEPQPIIIIEPAQPEPEPQPIIIIEPPQPNIPNPLQGLYDCFNDPSWQNCNPVYVAEPIIQYALPEYASTLAIDAEEIVAFREQLSAYEASLLSQKNDLDLQRAENALNKTQLLNTPKAIYNHYLEIAPELTDFDTSDTLQSVKNVISMTFWGKTPAIYNQPSDVPLLENKLELIKVNINAALQVHEQGVINQANKIMNLLPEYNFTINDFKEAQELLEAKEIIKKYVEQKINDASQAFQPNLDSYSFWYGKTQEYKDTEAALQNVQTEFDQINTFFNTLDDAIDKTDVLNNLFNKVNSVYSECEQFIQQWNTVETQKKDLDLLQAQWDGNMEKNTYLKIQLENTQALLNAKAAISESKPVTLTPDAIFQEPNLIDTDNTMPYQPPFMLNTPLLELNGLNGTLVETGIL